MNAHWSRTLRSWKPAAHHISKTHNGASPARERHDRVRPLAAEENLTPAVGAPQQCLLKKVGFYLAVVRASPPRWVWGRRHDPVPNFAGHETTQSEARAANSAHGSVSATILVEESLLLTRRRARVTATTSSGSTPRLGAELRRALVEPKELGPPSSRPPPRSGWCTWIISGSSSGRTYECDGPWTCDRLGCRHARAASLDAPPPASR